ncbi:MAG: hypothetical protein ACI87E_004878 [Mariniblastus sp.]|jgi:hypothetical protein
MIAGRAKALAPQNVKGAFLDYIAYGLMLGGVEEIYKNIEVFIGK